MRETKEAAAKLIRLRQSKEETKCDKRKYLIEIHTYVMFFFFFFFVNRIQIQ